MDRPKKTLAIDFINRIRTMEAAELNAMIVREAGEELAQFFVSYASSLMLMGYLIRAAEDRTERARTRQATLLA